jgi:tRNA threonylcarbamoyladenosine biosynthesis protein TsaB
MLILTLRTDKPEAELGLYEDTERVIYITWQAHRQLAETIHKQIDNLLKQHSKSLKDVKGIVVYQGPGSFTGLRIGLSVANALADSLPASIVGRTGDNWIEEGTHQLLASKNQTVVIPEYGSQAFITLPKK